MIQATYTPNRTAASNGAKAETATLATKQEFASWLDAMGYSVRFAHQAEGITGINGERVTWKTVDEEPKMSNTTYNTETRKAAYAAMSDCELAEAIDALLNLESDGWMLKHRELAMAELETRKAEAHELAHMENEQRWARQAVMNAGLGMFNEETDAICDLAVQVVRNYRRLAYDIRISRYSRQALAASRELQAEFDVQVNRGANGQWVLEFI